MKFDLMTKLQNAFLLIEKNAESTDSLSLLSERKASYALFGEQGFPSKNNEEWRYTDLRFIEEYDFEPVLGKSEDDLSDEKINSLKIGDGNSDLLVFVNGFFSRKHSKIKAHDNDIFIGSLRNAAGENDKYAELIGFDYSESEEAFVNLNNAFSMDGAFIYIPENVKLTETVQILHIIDTRSFNPFVNIKNIIIADQKSEIKIIETSAYIGDNIGFVNSVTEITLGCQGAVSYYQLQNESGHLYNLNTTNVVQKDATNFESNVITLRSKFVRNDLKVIHRGEQSKTILNGFYFPEGNDFVDNHTKVVHSLANNSSTQLYKGIIGGQAVAVFDGKVLVMPDAQQTVSEQSNKNVLLTDEATIHTKPQLEIYADDVQCSHGATSGSIDEDSLFYLQARAIGKDKAMSLLLNAFAADVIDRIGVEELRTSLKGFVAERLGISETDINPLNDDDN